jgi:F-type H+-transporting ATPase subunit b
MNGHETTATVGHENGSSAAGGLFSIDPGLALWTWVVFGILFIVLRKFAWKPMMDSVAQREKVLADAVEQAKQTKEELEQIAVKQETVLRKARDEARKIIDEGRNAASASAETIRERAAEDARRTVDDAKKQIEYEKEQALREIRNSSVDLVIAASEKLMVTALDDDSHRRIVEKQLEEL